MQDLLFELVKTDFKLRYHNSLLGFVWVLLKPFLLFLVLYTVFSYIFHNEPRYGLSLLWGILVFSYFAEGTSRGLTALFDKANIILKVNFPRHVTLVATTFHAGINFIFGMFIFMVFWLWNDPILHAGLLLVPVYLLLLTLMILGFSALTSILFIRLRDLQAVWEVLLNLIFYSTPIIYPLAILPEKLQRIITSNPLTMVIEATRGILFYQKTPDMGHLFILTVGVVLFSSFSFFFFQRHIHGIAEYF